MAPSLLGCFLRARRASCPGSCCQPSQHVIRSDRRERRTYAFGK